MMFTKSIFRFANVAGLLICGCLSVSVWSKPPVVLEFCYENNVLLPYYNGDGADVPTDNPGMNIVMLRHLDNMLPELTINYRREPRKRCLSSIESGKISGVIATYTKARETIGMFPKINGSVDKSRFFGPAYYCLYKPLESALDWNGSYFSGISTEPVAVPRGYSIIDKLRDEKLMYFEVKTSIKGFDLLSHNRVAAMVTLCDVGRGIIKENQAQFSRIVEDKPMLVKQLAYLMISKTFYNKNSALVEKMWDKLRMLNQQQ